MTARLERLRKINTLLHSPIIAAETRVRLVCEKLALGGYGKTGE
jgi:hypothetical protein